MILEKLGSLDRNESIRVVTIQPLCVYSEYNDSKSKCIDRHTGESLKLDDLINTVDNEYDLDVVDNRNSYLVYIPASKECEIRKDKESKFGVIVKYNNIEASLVFDDEPLDSFVEII